MSFKKDFYFCNECKKSVDNLEDLLFVEGGSSRSFCSEKCIEKYFAPITSFFEGVEKKLRKKYAVETEECLEFLSDVTIMEKSMTSPDEIWTHENGIKEEVYSFIKKVSIKDERPFYVIILCTIFDTYPGYVLLSTITESKFLMEEFRIGTEVDLSEHFSENENVEGIDITSDDVESIEQKKSEILANHVSLHSPADIPVENYELYDEYVESTMDSPDEIFKREDKSGDTIYTYIKAFDKEGVSFYYFVLCMRIDSASEDIQELIIPILNFPTVDGELYKSYHHGEKVSGALKN
ncbi:hypothetical protein [Halobacteriovorax sp. JY17]|uniref:hypothetical protein n=1 Tax=Halobacteriovorax sp. JY17 TaxID=2014617 RepID=UPI000C41B142|nr:hypothetical protein [Halobacteriovorax sp. JY17]PIK15891.1 MAG: hypothetical protein CES88_03965 [Halobacteriovorax sp. JY17]